MADHNKPTITSTYSNFVTELDDRFDDVSKMFDPSVVTATNVPVNTIAWLSASNKFGKWNGSAFADLSSSYDITVKYTPSGGISATTVQAAIAELDTEKFPKTGGAISGNITVGNTIVATESIEIAANGSGNRNAILDFVGDATYTDYGLRVRRYNTGANATSAILHRGTGTLALIAEDAGAIQLRTSNTTRLTIASDGVSTFAGQVNAQNTFINSSSVQVNALGSGNREAKIALVGDDTYPDYGMSVNRGNGGPNTTSSILHRGTGALRLIAADAGTITFITTNIQRFNVGASGQWGIGTTPSYGTAGQVFASGGASAAPVWASAILLKTTGQVNFVPLASAPTGANGDLHCLSTDGHMYQYNLGAWQKLQISLPFSAARSISKTTANTGTFEAFSGGTIDVNVGSAAGTGAGALFTIPAIFNSRTVHVEVSISGLPANGGVDATYRISKNGSYQNPDIFIPTGNSGSAFTYTFAATGGDTFGLGVQTTYVGSNVVRGICFKIINVV